MTTTTFAKQTGQGEGRRSGIMQGADAVETKPCRKHPTTA